MSRPDGQQKLFTRRDLLLAGLLLSAGAAILVYPRPQETKPKTPKPFSLSDYIQDGSPKEIGIGKGGVGIGLAYYNRTNLGDPVIKERVDEDIEFVRRVVSVLPVLGYTSISISAQRRYNYPFPAGGNSTYNKEINYVYLNLDERDEPVKTHVILHELGGHYLSVRQNRTRLLPFMGENNANRAEAAEIGLLNQIRRYKTEIIPPDQNKVIFESIRLGRKITLDQLIRSANSYPSEIWQHPQDFIQFQGRDVPLNELEKRADDELYADFTALVLQAQMRGLLNVSYEHPALKIFREVKTA